jgi:hypothetical protein
MTAGYLFTITSTAFIADFLSVIPDINRTEVEAIPGVGIFSWAYPFFQ